MTARSPFLAFSFLLLMLLAASLVIDTLGYVAGVRLVPYSLVIAALPCLWLTYGYCFPVNSRHIRTGLLLAAALGMLGFLSRYCLDFTPDGMGYQQPSAEALLNGWNPFGPPADMLWQNIYPSGVWAFEASLATLFGSVEATKMMQIWWLFIAFPALLAGIGNYKTGLTGMQVWLTSFTVISATVAAQWLTHYVDAPIYLAGLTFLGGLLMQGDSRRENLVSGCIMAACILFIVNAKLSGIYHAFMLCAVAVAFLWMKTKRIPWKTASLLLAAGMIAVFFIGYRPYVTSFIAYGPSLFPDSTEAFSGAQRPSSFDALPSFMRFFYSLFSVTGGAPHETAQLKLPWTMQALEWKFSGDPDARTGGFGPLFALAFLCAAGLFAYAAMRQRRVDKNLALIGFACLVFSACFPQGWWARYVPFAYAVPLFLLLAIDTDDKVVRIGMKAVIVLLACNSAIGLSSSLTLFYRNQTQFLEVARELRARPEGSVYLVPPVANYRKYNDAYMPLTRRFAAEGINVSLKVGAPCPHEAAMYAEYRVCY